MVLPDDPRDRPGKGDVLQDIVPCLWVLLDLGVLRLGELRRFVQDLRGKAEFPDIMNDPRHADAVDRLLRMPHLHRDRPRQVCNAPLMTRCIGVFHLHCARQNLQHCRHRPPQRAHRPVQVLLLLAKVCDRPLEIAGPLPDGHLQFCPIAGEEVDQNGQQEGDGECDSRGTGGAGC